jgi:bifunctional non-homologous end joining protein LigD
MLADLAAALRPLERPSEPFAPGGVKVTQRGVHWVEPRLVGEVEFSEWTRDGHLRQASWRGLRSDKDAATVVREP